jgi:hypothetical protein
MHRALDDRRSDSFIWCHSWTPPKIWNEYLICQNTRTCSSPLDLQAFFDYPAFIMDTKEALDVIGPSSTVSVTSCLYIRLMDWDQAFIMATLLFLSNVRTYFDISTTIPLLQSTCDTYHKQTTTRLNKPPQWICKESPSETLGVAPRWVSDSFTAWVDKHTNFLQGHHRPIQQHPPSRRPRRRYLRLSRRWIRPTRRRILPKPQQRALERLRF